MIVHGNADIASNIVMPIKYWRTVSGRIIGGRNVAISTPTDMQKPIRKNIIATIAKATATSCVVFIYFSPYPADNTS